MSTLPRFTVREYNNIAYMNDYEHATMLLGRLQADAKALTQKLQAMHNRYAEGIKQSTCDELAEVANTVLDELRDFDPAYLAETERRARELHDTYLLHIGYAAEHNAGGHC